MKKISTGNYEHFEGKIKYECIKRSNGNYDIYVNSTEQGRFKCGLGVSLDSCKRRIKDFNDMYYV